MDISIINFEKKYEREIKDTETNYWGQWEDNTIENGIDKYDLFLIALVNNKYAGHIYGNFVGDLFYFDVIIIKDEYRNNGVGTKLLEETIKKLKINNFKTIVTTAEHIDNNDILLKPLLEKFNFKAITDIKGYWGSLYPNVFCDCCKSKPCKCIATVFMKKI